MKVRSLKTYRDKYTREVVRVNTEAEMTEERVAEINAARGGPYVEVVADTPTKGKKKKEG